MIQLDYILNLHLSDKLGTLKLTQGELVYCRGNEQKIKTALIKSMGLGQMSISDNEGKDKDYKSRTALIFPELLFLNELNLEDNLKLYFEATKRQVDTKKSIELLSEFGLNPQQKINDLTMVEKIDFLICRSMLIQAKIIVLDSTILQLEEYDQDRILAELILYCRQEGATLLSTKYSDRLNNGFPGRIFGKPDNVLATLSA